MRTPGKMSQNFLENWRRREARSCICIGRFLAFSRGGLVLGSRVLQVYEPLNRVGHEFNMATPLLDDERLNVRQILAP